VGEALDASFLVVDDVEERAPVKLDMGEVLEQQ
jgi:hypothetical protein